MSDTDLHVSIVDTTIEVAPVWNILSNVDAGAHNVFLGKTRRKTGEELTDFLVYDAYRPMALSELERIARQASDRWDLTCLVIIHRLGRVGLDEASVAIGASSPHRKDVFMAVPWILEELKKTVPIWKQENWQDGRTEWVHP